MHIALIAVLVLGMAVFFNVNFDKNDSNVLGERTSSREVASPSPSPEERRLVEYSSPSPTTFTQRAPSPSPYVRILRSPSPSPVEIETPDLSETDEVKVEKENIKAEKALDYSRKLEATVSNSVRATATPGLEKSPQIARNQSPIISTVGNIISFVKSIFPFRN